MKPIFIGGKMWIINKGQTFPFYEELLKINITKEEFKVLIMILMEGRNNKIYVGKLKNIKIFLGISITTKTERIKQIMDSLKEKQLLEDYDIKKSQWTLIFNENILNDKTIIQLDKEWVNQIKKFKGGKNREIDWGNLLKVFIYFFIKKSTTLTAKEIAKELKLTEKIIYRASDAMRQINKTSGFDKNKSIISPLYYQNSSKDFCKNKFYIYKYENIEGQIVYIGQTIDPERRFYEHTKDKLQNFSGTIYYAECGSKKEMDFIEQILINHYKPKFNIDYKDENEKLSLNFITIEIK